MQGVLPALSLSDTHRLARRPIYQTFIVMAEIFLYNLHTPKGEAIEQLCAGLHIKCRHIEPRDYLERLGFMTGNPGFERIGLPFTGNAFKEEMMLLKNFEGNTLDHFLDAYRKAGITPVFLKAALTPTNIHWNTLQLYEELARERRAFEAYMKP